MAGAGGGDQQEWSWCVDTGGLWIPARETPCLFENSIAQPFRSPDTPAALPSLLAPNPTLLLAPSLPQIILSVAEHHANLVPWQLLAARTGAVLRHVRLTPDRTQLDMNHFRTLLSPRTRLISLVHVSNVLGCVLDAAYVAEQARAVGARLLLDCCQSVPHSSLDVTTLGADWIVASSHKFCGPSGVGFLWGSYELLEEMGPWMGGGEMIQDVFLDHSTYAPPPARFEAGTPAIAETIGMGAAAEWLRELGMGRVHDYEQVRVERGVLGGLHS